MTAPVRTKVGAAAGPFCKNSYTVSFFVPHAFRHHPPKPNNPEVYIEKEEGGFTAFVAQASWGWRVSDGSGSVQRAVGSGWAGGQPTRLRGGHILSPAACAPGVLATPPLLQKGGFVLDDWSVQAMVKGLSEALDAQGLPYDPDSFFVAGYDSPARITGRHNEVWLLAQEEGAAAPPGQ